MRTLVVLVMVSFLLVSGAGLAAAQVSQPAKMSRDLAMLATPPTYRAAPVAVPPDSWTPVPPVVTGDWVAIDTVALGDPATLEAELIALGATNTAIAGRMVSALFPIATIPALEHVASLQFARRALRTTNVGLVTSQGDAVLKGPAARSTFDVDGTGVMVGVLSDSYNCQFGAAGDIASGDLSPVLVLQDDPGCGSGTDEGRAMLQIVQDVAPGAALAFATAEGGQANFANNIRALRAAGADVIVDDVIYFAEPMFQDGIIAQAVEDVVADGASYFSSAGNNGSKAYAQKFVPGTPLAPGTYGANFLGGIPHNFSAGVPRQTIMGTSGSQFTLVLQWDSPFFSVSGPPGNQYEVDLYLLAAVPGGGFQVVAAETTNNLLINKGSGDPVAIMGPIPCVNKSCTGYIMIVSRTGPPSRFKYVLLTRGAAPSLSPALNAGTIYGHANAVNAIAVGAANYKTPTTVESFSSTGTTPVLFDIFGDSLDPIDPRAHKPEIVAPDGADTTFFGQDTDATGFPNFFGTSAAAPHAAAVAALMKQGVPTLDHAGIRSVLENTAQNMGAAGFDTTTGFGLIQADLALKALHQLTITSGPNGTPSPVAPGGTVDLSVDATDTFPHTLTWAWTSTCTGGITNGSFNDATLRNPTWTAGVNATGASQTCAFKVTVDDGHGVSKFATFNETVLSVPKITTLTPTSGTIGTSLTIAGLALTGATQVKFAGAAPVTPTAVTATSLKAVVPAGSGTGPVSVTTPAGTGVSAGSFQVVLSDLKVLSVTVPATLAPGQNASVSHVVKNVALAPGVAGPTTSRLYLSSDATLDVGSDVVLGDAAVGTLAGGVSATVTRTMQIPPGTAPGRYWIIAQANATNTVQEADSPGQANNVAATARSVIVGPDLVVTAATATPATVTPGRNVSVTYTVKNQGGQAAGAFNVGVYLSTNNTYDDGVDVQLGSRAVAGLAAGAVSTATVPVTIPPGQAPGTYFLIVRADIAAAVTEADEENNARSTGSVQVVSP